jgi:hypothetical protein
MIDIPSEIFIINKTLEYDFHYISKGYQYWSFVFFDKNKSWT